MSRVIANVHTYFNPSRDEFVLNHHVSGVENGIAYVSFAMPEKMIRAFVDFLESMAKFFKIVDIRVRSASAQSRVISVDEIARVKKIREEINRAVCSTYDKHLSKGLSVTDAISLTNKELKLKYFNLSYDSVKGILSKAGKFRSNKQMK